MKTSTKTFALLLILTSAAACRDDAEGSATDAAPDAVAQATPVDAGETGHADHIPADLGALDGDGPWTKTSSMGSHVTMRVGSAPLVAGGIDVAISVHAVAEGAAARSIDLVSPTMPMHGVVRYPVHDGAAHLTIPMEGAWALYVNLDEAGSDSAEFLFAVAPGDSPTESHH